MIEDRTTTHLDVIPFIPRYYGSGREENPHDKPLPPEPTDYLPGTPEKMDVMSWRVTNNYHIHHPLDAKIE